MKTHRPGMLLLWGMLLVTQVGLTSLAYASPPDPTWVSGFFDDDDDDNGVFLITSCNVTIDPFPLYACTPSLVFGPTLVLEDPGAASSQHFSTADSRAPPTS